MILVTLDFPLVPVTQILKGISLAFLVILDRSAIRYVTKRKTQVPVMSSSLMTLLPQPLSFKKADYYNRIKIGGKFLQYYRFDSSRVP